MRRGQEKESRVKNDPRRNEPKSTYQWKGGRRRSSAISARLIKSSVCVLLRQQQEANLLSHYSLRSVLLSLRTFLFARLFRSIAQCSYHQGISTHWTVTTTVVVVEVAVFTSRNDILPWGFHYTWTECNNKVIIISNGVNRAEEERETRVLTGTQAHSVCVCLQTVRSRAQWGPSEFSGALATDWRLPAFFEGTWEQWERERANVREAVWEGKL